MKKSIWYIFLLVITGYSCRNHGDLVGLVDPFIGTGSHGHTFPGAAIPFGMVQLSPDTRKDSWDGCSGYHYSDSTIMGFSHTHLSGTGCGDLGDIRFMPTVGEVKIKPGTENDPASGYRSRFSHQKEKASPGYYQVFLEDYMIGAAFTVTRRCGFHQYTFPATEAANIIIDLKESVVTEDNLELSIQIINDHEISGLRKSSGWAADQSVYFYAIFSRPFESYGTASDGEISENSHIASGKDVQAYVKYHTKENEKILVKVGISGVSIEGARKNLVAEIPDWNFEQVRKQAESDWIQKIGRIEVKGGSQEDRKKFYTALYHCYLAPSLFSDSDGQYRGSDGKVHQSKDFDVYTVFSLWDTYRALHPLMTILEPKRTTDFIQTFIDIYEKSGLLPVWELAGNETNCMIGYHAVPVIVDAYLKGIGGFDAEKAYTAIRNNADQDHYGLKYYKEYGYIPAEMEGEAISKTLEYAYDDWCIAMMAKELGKVDDYRYYIQRAQNYKNLFDPDTRFLRGKRNGMFTMPFDPTEVNFMLTEANTWQYTFYVPQDISGLENLMGGDALFEEKLDEMFSSSIELSGREQSDITGLIGQYAHGNEPSHHMAYLYNYAGKPFKTQKLAREIMRDLYSSEPDGLCGNEDCGQMSAWFVLSAMGFYPVTPGAGYYAIGSPLFEEIRINLENGKDFIISARNNRAANIYIQSAQLNGKKYDKSFLDHELLLKGGILSFEMGPNPDKNWASSPGDWPVSGIFDNIIAPVPYFEAPSSSFQDSIIVKLRHINPNAGIYYNFSSSSPVSDFKVYSDSITIDQAASINAYAVLDSNILSKIATASFFHIHHDWTISIKNTYSNQYTGGGDMALIDGQHGGPNFRTGSWQGYYGVDFEVIIDMGRVANVNKIAATFLQDQRSWIFMPEKVEFSVSRTPDNFRTVAIIENDLAGNFPEAVIKEIEKDRMKESARFIRVQATNLGTCPAWHVGAGEKAWIFVDEITVE
jgi:predicted alpha-1,2-mannosidase